MPTYSHILCPVDFSAVSRRALRHASALALRSGARLRVAHVLLPMPPVSRGVRGDAGLIATTRRAVEAELEQLLAPIRAAGVAVTSVLLDGYVVQRLVDEAESAGVDLIVTGTHGRSGVDRILLGSVTEKLLRKAPCAVLTVPAGVEAGDDEDVAFNTILCPVDFSSATTPAVRAAASLAGDTGGQLVLLHVLEGPAERDWPEPYRPALAASREENSRAAVQRLEALVPESLRGEWRARVMVESGRPASAIVDVAASHQADLIVMGTHGGNVLTRAYLGTTADGVIRRASCPVLTVPPDGN
jgi:nucleotide-binding universal stress UspA family protein